MIPCGELRAEGISIGERNKALELARKLKRKGNGADEIVELTGLFPNKTESVQ